MTTNTCRHFNGVHGPGMKPDHIQCTVGQSINDYREHDGRMYTWGCINGNTCKSKCPKFDPYTKAECDSHDAEIRMYIAGVCAARNAIPSVGSSGVAVCPECGGRLHWTRSSYNGHVHGKCETKDCLQWME